MKKIIFLFALYSFLTTSTHAQWWVSGGNLIWPYGDVKISKNLNVDGTINGAKIYNFLFTHDGGTGSPSITNLFNNIGSSSTWIRVSTGSYKTTFTGITFVNTKTFNTRSVTIDNGDTQISYLTYTSGSDLFIQIYDLSTLSAYDPTITRLPVSLIYYP